MRYAKAPILEAAIEFRWANAFGMDDLKKALEADQFSDFENTKTRQLINAAIDAEKGEVSQDSRKIGYEVALSDGSERILLEENKFVYVRTAPYSHWEEFCGRALEIFFPTIIALGVKEFTRLGVRFINRIDAPKNSDGKINTDDYISIKFDGPREDMGEIDEFQMRVVKPTKVDGISYALVVATSSSPLTDCAGIILDIDVFTKSPVPFLEYELRDKLSAMRIEKNGVFESCITDKSREHFGGILQ